MIDLELTDDHEALLQTVREFAQIEVAPYIKEWDEKQEFHREVFDKMAGLNLLGVCIPESYGGAGGGFLPPRVVWGGRRDRGKSFFVCHWCVLRRCFAL